MATLKLKFRKIAVINDEATGKYTELYEFPVTAKDCARLEVARSKAHDHRQFVIALRDHGALLPKDGKQCKELLIALAKMKAVERRTYAAETGWLGGKWLAYVTIDGVIGKPPAGIIGIKRADDIADPTGQVSRSGTAESWICVAERARASSILMLAICAAFAAPLLNALSVRSFGINIFGRSRIGNTIATLVGASVPGIGKVEDLSSWAITNARLEQRLPESKDSLFPIEDLMKMGGKDREKYKRARDLAYLIEQGQQTARHSSFTQQHGGVHRRYLSILLTSCEFSIAELAEQSNTQRFPGEAVRFIDVPALLDGGDHIFDRLTQDITGQAFMSWKDEMFSGIVHDCAENHGAVLERYIENLIHTGREKTTTYVQRRIAEFTHHVSDETDGDLARDVTGKFGLLYGAGRVAIKLKLLPWTNEELLDAIAKCYRAARGLLPDKGVALRRGVKTLEKRLRSLPRLSDLPTGDAAKGQYAGAAGYRRREGSVNICIIKCEAFNGIFASTSDRDLVLEWLLQQGRITTAVSKKAAPGSSLEPKEQFTWPDGKRRRSYEIRDPLATVEQRQDR